MKDKKKLPSISIVKKSLYDHWSLEVKRRDGFKCVLCGSEVNVTAHHWYCCDHHAHTARYCVHNGVTLCYACHIRTVHTRADWQIVHSLETYFRNIWGDLYDTNVGSIETLVKTELTVGILRRLWNEFRGNSKVLLGHEWGWTAKGNKRFLHTSLRFSKFETVVLAGYVYEILVVTKEKDGWRYTVRPYDMEGESHERTGKNTGIS